eukprot:15179-Eustigmatos_ZCMA.PRE.1
MAASDRFFTDVERHRPDTDLAGIEVARLYGLKGRGVSAAHWGRTRAGIAGTGRGVPARGRLSMAD